jgi:hypothetical protein
MHSIWDDTVKAAVSASILIILGITLAFTVKAGYWHPLAEYFNK